MPAQCTVYILLPASKQAVFFACFPASLILKKALRELAGGVHNKIAFLLARKSACQQGLACMLTYTVVYGYICTYLFLYARDYHCSGSDYITRIRIVSLAFLQTAGIRKLDKITLVQKDLFFYLKFFKYLSFDNYLHYWCLYNFEQQLLFVCKFVGSR